MAKVRGLNPPAPPERLTLQQRREELLALIGQLKARAAAREAAGLPPPACSPETAERRERVRKLIADLKARLSCGEK
jgi:hypothetical protein